MLLSHQLAQKGHGIPSQYGGWSNLWSRRSPRLRIGAHCKKARERLIAPRCPAKVKMGPGVRVAGRQAHSQGGGTSGWWTEPSWQLRVDTVSRCVSFD
jgi:hypothetical protein